LSGTKTEAATLGAIPGSNRFRHGSVHAKHEMKLWRTSDEVPLSRPMSLAVDSGDPISLPFSAADPMILEMSNGTHVAP